MEEEKTIVDPKMDVRNDEKETKTGADKKSKGLGVGAAVGIGVGAAAMAAAGLFIPFKVMGKNDGPVNPDDLNQGEENAADTENLVSETTAANHTPVESDLNVATSVNDDMTFDQAFAAARNEVGGGGGMFYWHGKGYGTYTKDEWDSLSPEDKSDYWASVNHTHSDYVQTHTDPIKTEFSISDIEDVDLAAAYFVDANGNGTEDLILDIDGDGNGDVLLLDVARNHDGDIVSVGEVQQGHFAINSEEDDPSDDIDSDDADSLAFSEIDRNVDFDDDIASENADYDLTADTSFDPNIDIDNAMDTTDLV